MDTNLQSILTALAQRDGGQSSSLLITTLIIAAVAPTLAALIGYLQSRANATVLAASKAEIIDGKKEFVVLKEHVNSKMDLLLKKSEEVAHAAGAAEQRTTTAIVNKLDNGNKIRPDHPVVLAILEEIRRHDGPKI